MHSSELVKTLNDKLDSEFKLPAQLTDQITGVMRCYVDALLQLEAKNDPAIVIETVDFPAFVSDLIQGTFNAIVDASIQQMESYSDLLQEVAKTVDQFMAEMDQSGNAMDYLAEQVEFDFFASSGSKTAEDLIDCEKLKRVLHELDIDLAFDCPPNEEQLKAVREAFEVRSRQKFLATMVLTGINRIIVTDRRITAKSSPALQQ